MTTIAAALLATLRDSLIANLPAAVSEHFDDVDKDEFKEFLTGFLDAQLKGAGKGKGSKKAKVVGHDGKGRSTGYLLFSKDARSKVKAKNPNMPFGEVGKELGKMWQALSEKEKAKWNQKSSDYNEENGTAGEKKASKEAPAKKGKAPAKEAPAKKGKAPAKEAPAKKGKAPAKGKASTEEQAKTGEMKVIRDKDAKVWLIADTKFIVQSPKNKVVIGKLQGEKTVPLSAADKKKCSQSGWLVKGEAEEAPQELSDNNNDDDDEDDDEDDE